MNIVYASNSGFTKKYAILLGEQTGIKVYELKEALAQLEKDSEILFMGWMCAGMVKGFAKAAKNYKVMGVCGVGMGTMNDDTQRQGIVTRLRMPDESVFYLQGGYDITKLHGMNKFMMKMIGKTVVKKYEEKEDKTPEEIQMLDLYKNGGDFVSVENLSKVIAWVNKK